MLDTLRRVETPEGVTLELRVAGLVPRAAAWLADAVFRFLLLGVLSTIAGLTGRTLAGPMLIGVFLILWFYPVLFETLNQGRTPGKSIMGLRVVNQNALPVGWLPSLIRNLLRVVDMFPILYGFGLVSMLLDRDFRRLGDRVAGTLVVHDARPRAPTPIQATGALMPPQPLRAEEQTAVLAFAERMGYLTEERQMELAEICEPLTGYSGGVSVKRLLAYANWILGRR